MSACPPTAAREQTFRDRSFGPIPEVARLFDHLVGEGEQIGLPRRRTAPLNGGVGAVMTAVQVAALQSFRLTLVVEAPAMKATRLHEQQFPTVSFS